MEKIVNEVDVLAEHFKVRFGHIAFLDEFAYGWPEKE
jgi:hypothetical protein